MVRAAKIPYNGDMKRFLCLLAVLAFISGPAAAQDSIIDPIVPSPGTSSGPTGKAGEITKTPQCFNVINKAPYTVLGTVLSDVYHTPDGTAARHRSNFNLKTGEQTQFCATGPYYEGGKLELVIRTLVPVFSCKTRVDADIVINGRKKPEGGTDTWAVCR